MEKKTGWEWLPNGDLKCHDCGVVKSRAGCDGCFGCTCDAHSHIEFHDKTDFMLLPSVRNKTPNQLEGFEIDK
jgi:hypothetical protein